MLRFAFTIRLLMSSIGAIIFGGIHWTQVAVPVILAGGKGDVQVGRVLTYDIPLLPLTLLLPEDGTGPYIALVAFGGTAVYSVVGAFVGLAIAYPFIRRRRLINVNTATAGELARIPYLRRDTRQAIIDNRPYTTPEELMRVPGIKQRMLARIGPYVSVK
jgi:hypothetical protein